MAFSQTVAQLPRTDEKPINARMHQANRCANAKMDALRERFSPQTRQSRPMDH
jgi:hypothetical protein